MEFHSWLSLITICILGALSPGPSLALIINNTIKGGQAQGYATALSHALGVLLYAALTSTGIALVLVELPLVFKLIQYAGAGFLLYLGIKALFNANQKVSADKQNVCAKNEQRLAYGNLDSSTQNSSNLDSSTLVFRSKTQVCGWRDGFLIAFLNPKLAIFFLALFSQFITETTTIIQKMVMTFTVGGIDALWYIALVFMMSKCKLNDKLKRHHILIDKITGIVLIGIAIRVILV